MMWFYDCVSRNEFEKRKDYAEQAMCEFGAVILHIKLPYEQKTTSWGVKKFIMAKDFNAGISAFFMG